MPTNRDGLQVQPRGVPKEMAFQRLMKDSKTNRDARWRRHHAEIPATCGGPSQRIAQEAAATARNKTRTRRDAPAFPGGAMTAYGQLGQIPTWREERYVVPHAEERRHAGVHRVSSEPYIKKIEGDHSLGIQGSTPHFYSSYTDLGQGWNLDQVKHEVSNAKELRDAKVIGSSSQITNTKRIEGDHSRGIWGGGPMFTSSYGDLGQIPNWPEKKLELQLAQTLRDAGVPPPKIPPKDIEGDMSQGIKGQIPHFAATYWNHGKFPGWEKTQRKDDTAPRLWHN